MGNAIETIGLTKRYKDVTAVDGLDLCVRQGELFALLGVNGAGKSTTVRLLCGLTPPTAGDALLCGHSIAREPAQVKRLIGVSPQETAIAPNLTAEENLALMGGVYGLPREERQQRTARLSAQLGLDEVRRKKSGRLSGGWQRRLSLAMALLADPQILFLDEPTLGLDVLARAELWDIIRALKGHTTVVLTTHYMEEAEELADRIAIMRGGRLLALGTADELKEKSGCGTLESAFIRIVKGESGC